MPYLRFACLLAGLMVLLAPPAMLYPTGVSSNELAPAAGMLTLLLLAAASFFFIALAGHRIYRSPRLRRLSVPLLSAPFLAGIVGLWGSSTPTALWLSGLLLGFTLSVAALLASPSSKAPAPAACAPAKPANAITTTPSN